MTLEQFENEEENKFLPIAVVGRMMRDTLTPCPEILQPSLHSGFNSQSSSRFTSAKISKEAKETMQEFLTEFILFMTSEAWEICESNDRKTILGTDLIKAMHNLDFDHYVDILGTQ